MHYDLYAQPSYFTKISQRVALTTSPREQFILSVNIRHQVQLGNAPAIYLELADRALSRALPNFKAAIAA